MTAYDLGVPRPGTLIGNVIIVPAFMFTLLQTRTMYLRPRDIVYDGPMVGRLDVMAGRRQPGVHIAWLSGFERDDPLYGNATVNAFQVGNKINSLVLNPAMGIGAVTATFVGQNIGAGNEAREAAGRR